MSCEGHVGDYNCSGWRLLADRIRERDGNRCRCCNRGAAEVSLEVHHRIYGDPGRCGDCVLTGVTDDDLVTLCGGVDGCHKAITSVRRAIRYATHAIEITTTAAPPSILAPIRIKAEVTIGIATAPVPAGTVARKSEDLVVSFVPEPAAAGPVIRKPRFNPFGED